MRAAATRCAAGTGSTEGGAPVDTELFAEQIQVERKLFSFDLRENPRGRFLKVTEDVGGRRDTVIIPATGLTQVRDVIERVIAASASAGPAPVDTSLQERTPA
jgi:hypothetical protein